jgi:RHH-type proline utilization regulon transcriptional repressor/proline dehydrogenase/delta 1-pyrroline-5-carboxylate dehydrogenase
VLVNASTWGLMLTGKLVDLADDTKRDVHGAFKRLVGRAGEPVIRLAVRQAMKIMGHQFVMGRTIDEALSRSRKGDNANYRYSFDMLGEGALTTKDALRYLEAYRQAIHAIGSTGPFERRVRRAQHLGQAVRAAPALRARQARPRAGRTGTACWNWRNWPRRYGIGLTIDAEETDRLELSLDLIFQVLATLAARLEGFGIGRAGLPEARAVRDRLLADMAAGSSAAACRCAWSRARTGMPRSSARRSKARPAIRCSPASRTPTCRIWPMRAACSMPATRSTRCSPPTTRRPSRRSDGAMACAAGRDFEFQKLHGMGDDLYAEVIPADRLDVPCRVYAPVGSHEDLLPYLVRRLLENGANSSFVNRITDETSPSTN